MDRYYEGFAIVALYLLYCDFTIEDFPNKPPRQVSLGTTHLRDRNGHYDAFLRHVLTYTHRWSRYPYVKQEIYLKGNSPKQPAWLAVS